MDKLAFENVSGKLFHITKKEIEQGIEASRKSTRKRMILPIHRSQPAPVQRMINFLQPGTYIRPHLHPRHGASETIIVISGSLRFYIFDEDGNVIQEFYLTNKTGENLLDMEPNVWHSFVVSEPDTIIYEFKMGPYDKELDKTFAKWSPEEGSSEVQEFLAELSQRTENR
jgi:cupin fold WbuC family metalloprotein